MTFEVLTLLTRKDPTMTTPKKYTSVTRVGVTAEFTAFPTSKGFVKTATFNFNSIRSFMDWVHYHNPTVTYIVINDPMSTQAILKESWSRTSIAPYINSACKCTIVARLDCGECGHLTFYRSKR